MLPIQQEAPTGGATLAVHDVVVADDAPSLRSLLRMLLDEEPDFRVVGEAADGVEAVRLTLLHRPDLVLLDVAMPGLDGLRAARRLRAEGYTGRIVVFSGYGRPELGVEAARCGADDWIEKGTGVVELVDRLRGIADRPCPGAGRL